MDYEEQLDRALSETPETGTSGDRLNLPEPEVRQEGNVIVYENFQATIDRLDRDGSDVLKFLQRELGTSAHIDERGRARLTGSFGADRIGAAIDEFAQSFVICPECGLPDTRIVEEQGERVLRCDACGAIAPTA